jgi:hypothetical protein
VIIVRLVSAYPTEAEARDGCAEFGQCDLPYRGVWVHPTDDEELSAAGWTREPAADHHARLAAGTEWVCQGCGYHNNGGICTHCGRLAAGTEEG